MNVIKMKCAECGAVSTEEYKTIYELPAKYTCYGCGKAYLETTELFRVFNLNEKQKRIVKKYRLSHD